MFISMNETTDPTFAKRRLAAHYDKDAENYYKRNYLNETVYSPQAFRQHYIEQMIESAEVPRGSRILDVGCGPGALILSLLKKGYRVWGADISSRMIKEAVELVQGTGFPGFDQLVVGDVEALEFDDAFFDVVVASGVIEYQQTDTGALNEINRVLANRGYLIINVTNRYSPYHLLRPLYQPLKRLRLARTLLGAVKRDAMRLGELETIPRARTHRPSCFDRILEAHGFKKLRHNYFHFALLPAPFDALPCSVCLWAGRTMEQLSTTALGRLGGGYLVIARKLHSVS